MNRAVEAICAWLRAAREWQQDALTEMQRLDAAVSKHMAHGAMAGGDPLTNSLFDQMQAAAEEGAQQPATTGAGLTPQQLAALADSQADDWWLNRLMPACVAAAAVAAFAHRLGWLS